MGVNGILKRTLRAFKGSTLHLYMQAKENDFGRK